MDSPGLHLVLIKPQGMNAPEALFRGLLVALLVGVIKHRCSQAAPEDSPGTPFTLLRDSRLDDWMLANKDAL